MALVDIESVRAKSGNESGFVQPKRPFLERTARAVLAKPPGDLPPGASLVDNIHENIHL